MLKLHGLDSAPIGIYQDALQSVVHVITENFWHPVQQQQEPNHTLCHNDAKNVVSENFYCV